MRRLLAALIVLGSAATAHAYWQSRAQVSISVAGYTGPGDVVSGAYFWVGFRGYNTADTANAANVCLPSDTVCADLTLSSGDVVVPGSLSTCNITTVICTVKTMYNKGSGGSGLDVTNATAANRPTFRPAIVSNGCATTAKPCMLFTAASSQFLASAGTSTQAQPITVSVVFNSAASTGDMYYNNILLYRNGTNQVALYAGSILNNTAADSTWHAIQAVLNGASSIGYVDGSSSSGDAGAGAGAGIIGLGVVAVTSQWGGYMEEAGAWAAAFNGTQQVNMNSNQHAYYGGF